MNFLITGITGFAGPHLAELLIKNNHTVYGLIMCSNGRENDIRDVMMMGSYEELIKTFDIWFGEYVILYK